MSPRLRPAWPVFLFAAVLLRAAGPDFAAAESETLARLQELVRIDTSNPPGNETAVAERLKAVLDREGIPAEILASAPHRGNLVARLKGSGRKAPLLLMAHTDVVGVERDRWTVDPFAAVVRDGYLYGRGAVDDKSMVAAFLQVLLLLHRERVALERDVIFAAVADEEMNGLHGIRFLVERHWDKIACEFALNEGGNTVEESGRVTYVGVATTEKFPQTFFLAARGVSTHASRPRLDNAVTHLAAAVARVGEWQPPMKLNDTTRAFFAHLARISPPTEAWRYARLEDPAVGPSAQEIIRRTDPVLNAMLRTTISPTIIKGGFRMNVVPADATATLDVRLLPGEDVAAFAAQLRALVADPAVEVIAAEHDGRQPAPPSSLTSELYLALERAQRRAYPGSVTVPIMSTGATDSAYLRPRGVQVYGVRSAADPADGGPRAHGNDERLKLDGLRPFLEFVYHAVADVAAEK
ncbi:MAG: M20/M25/M40 family metallo-hydrolase [Opitutaceae bacterium]|nr:M20/M25/M40 family metallo-hydrolase [Opitutaceae bacterium]